MKNCKLYTVDEAKTLLETEHGIKIYETMDDLLPFVAKKGNQVVCRGVTSPKVIASAWAIFDESVSIESHFKMILVIEENRS